MTPTESIAYLLSLQPTGIKLGLENMRQLCSALDHPEKGPSFVHIAGTNGKGSVAAMLESILRAAGIRTGLYTSPHLVDFCERIRINGIPIPLEELSERVARLRRTLEELSGEGLRPTFFEATTALALSTFRDQGCRLVVLETGLGGRLDSTNVVDPVATAITSIGFDHMEFLGNSLREIAGEKAGIIKPGRPVVIGQMPGEAGAVIQAKAREQRADLTQAGTGSPTCWDRLRGRQRLTWRGQEFNLALAGTHQAANACIVLELVEILRRQGWDLPGQAVCAGLEGVEWPARFEILQSHPPVVLDGGHNPDGIRSALEVWCECFDSHPGRIIFGCMRDKDLATMVPLLDHAGWAVDLVPVSSPRSADPGILAGHFHQSATRTFPQLAEAFALQQKDPHPAGTLILGSLYLAGEWKSLQEARPHQLGLNG